LGHVHRIFLKLVLCICTQKTNGQLKPLVNMVLRRNPDLPFLMEGLAQPQRLAISLASPSHKEGYAALFLLDARLGRLVASANEIVLGQMRLAWWRDQLNTPVEERPHGDAVLDLLGRFWAGHEAALIELVNGWEELLASDSGSEQAAEQFAKGRAAPFLRFAADALSHSSETDINLAARRWALIDLAANSSTQARSDQALRMAGDLGHERAALNRDLRPLALLDGLARRAVKRSARGQPVALLGDRLSPFAALRLGFFGR
jgi:phytoene synthase